MPKILSHIPDLELINESGERERFHDMIKGKTVVLNMFYSTCQLKCIPATKLMKQVNVLLKDYIDRHDIVFISITLDAMNDRVPEINRFKDVINPEGCKAWRFCTGNYQEIEGLRHKIGMYNPEPEIDAIKSNHPAHFLLMNEKTNFIKHTSFFDNPVDVARKVLQITTKNFYNHSYELNGLNYDALSDQEIFQNIQSMNSVFTLPFLPKHILERYDEHAEKQRISGFRFDPLNNDSKINSNGSCCSCNR